MTEAIVNPESDRPKREASKPERLDRRSWASLGVFILANGVNQVGMFVSMAAVARWLGPADMGLWILVLTAVRYATYAPLGVTAAIVVTLPVALAQKRDNEARKMADVAFWCSLVAGGLVVGGVTGVLYSGSVSAKQTAVAIGCSIGLLEQLQIHWRSLARAQGRFYVASLTLLLGGLCLLGLVLPAARWLGLGMALVALACKAAIPSLIANACLPAARFPSDVKILGQLLRIGIPMMLINIAMATVLTLDRVMIATLVEDETALGLYSPAVFVTMGMLALPQVVTSFMYTRMGNRYGRTGLASTLWHDAIRLAVALEVGALAIGLPVLLAGPWVVRRFIPQYESGIVASQVMAVAVAIGTWQFAFQPVLMFLKRVWLYLGVLLVTLAIEATCLVVAIRGEYGLTGVAVAMLITYSSLSIAMFGFSRWACRTVPSASDHLP